MLIEQIRVFKTPLDSDYKNVYDGYSSLYDYYNFLSANFQYKDISVTTQFPHKSVKDIDGNFDITVEGVLSSDLHDYNYIYFKINKGGGDFHRFGFIVKIESVNDHMNDGLTTGIYATCKLTCKYDTWTNHYLEIKNSFNSVEENRCTIDTILHPNYPTALKGQSFDERVTIESAAFISEDSAYTGNNFILPVWQRILTVDPFEFIPKDLGDGYEITKELNMNGYPAVYFLAGIYTFNGNQKELVPSEKLYQLSFTMTDSNTRTINIEPSVIWASQVETKSTKVIENSIVTCVPFTYTISEGTVSDGPDAGRDYIRITIDNVKVAFGNRGKFPYTSTQGAEQTEIFSSVYEGVAPYFITGDKTVIEHSIPTSDLNLYFPWHRYEINNYRETALYEYPIKYYSLYIKGKDTPLVGEPNSYDEVLLTYDCDKKMTAHISVSNIGDTTRYFVCAGDRNLPILFSNYDEYMLYHQSEMSGALVKSIIHGLSSAGTGAASIALGNAGGFGSIVAGVGNIAGGAIDYASKTSDLLRSGSELSNSGTNSFDSPLFETPFIVLHQAKNIEQINSDLHRYGYICKYIDSIFSMRRDVFDIDTGELTISALMANSDRKEIENAVSRGITRWHINGVDGDYSIARQNILKSMNRDVANYPVSQIPTT